MWFVKPKIIQCDNQNRIVSVNIGDKSEEEQAQEMYTPVLQLNRQLESKLNVAHVNTSKKPHLESNHVVALSRRMQLDLHNHI